MVKWNILIMLRPRGDEEVPTFKWETSKHSGKAKVRWLNYDGGDSVSVSGPNINKDGSIGLINRQGEIKLIDLPPEILGNIHTELDQIYGEIYTAKWNYVNCAAIRQTKLS